MNEKWNSGYSDPRWQRRRLEILQRDDFSCRGCGSKEKPLHVHHVIYKSGHSVWEYEDDDLVTYCDECHQMIERSITIFRQMVVKIKNPLHALHIAMALDISMIKRSAADATGILYYASVLNEKTLRLMALKEKAEEEKAELKRESDRELKRLSEVELARGI